MSAKEACFCVTASTAVSTECEHSAAYVLIVKEGVKPTKVQRKKKKRDILGMIEKKIAYRENKRSIINGFKGANILYVNLSSFEY